MHARKVCCTRSSSSAPTLLRKKRWTTSKWRSINSSPAAREPADQLASKSASLKTERVIIPEAATPSTARASARSQRSASPTWGSDAASSAHRHERYEQPAVVLAAQVQRVRAFVAALAGGEH